MFADKNQNPLGISIAFSWDSSRDSSSSPDCTILGNGWFSGMVAFFGDHPHWCRNPASGYSNHWKKTRDSIRNSHCRSSWSHRTLCLMRERERIRMQINTLLFYLLERSTEIFLFFRGFRLRLIRSYKVMIRPSLWTSKISSSSSEDSSSSAWVMPCCLSSWDSTVSCSMLLFIFVLSTEIAKKSSIYSFLSFFSKK